MAKGKKTFRGRMVVYYDIIADTKDEARSGIDHTHFDFKTKPDVVVKNTDIKKMDLVEKDEEEE